MIPAENNEDVLEQCMSSMGELDYLEDVVAGIDEMRRLWYSVKMFTRYIADRWGSDMIEKIDSITKEMVC